MKKWTLLLTSMGFMNFAYTATTSQATLNPVKSFNKNIDLTLEAETLFQRADRDEDYEINGSSTMYKVEPGYRLNKKTTVSLSQQYFDRVSDEGSKDKNIDDIGETTLKLLYKPTKFKENGIADVRLQARANYQSSDFFREYYGNNGDLQVRAYFGRPLAGNFKINKYTSYIRYKRYLVNDYASAYTRNHEYRLRVSPTYQVTDKLETGLTFTYNHIIEVDKDDSEKFEVAASARYAFTREYALLGIATVPTLKSSDDNRLEEVQDKMDQVEYLINFAIYL